MPHQLRQAVIVPDVHRDGDGAAGVLRPDLRRHDVGGRRVAIRHDDVRTCLGEPPRRCPPDAAPPPDHHGDVAGDEQRRALVGILLFDLAPLERPVLEREHLRLGNELEPADRFGVRNGLEHGAVAQVGRHRSPLVPERGDHPHPRGEDDLGPIVQRALPSLRVAPVVLLIFHPLPRDLGADRLGQLIWRRGRIELEPQRKPAGAQDVLRRRHPAADQRLQALVGEHPQHVVAVLEMQDHAAHSPSGRAKHPAHHRQHDLGATPARLWRRHRAGRRCRHRAPAPPGLEVVRDAVHDAHQVCVALSRVVSPHRQSVMRQREARGARGNAVHHGADGLRQRKPGAHVRHVHDLSLKQLADQPLRRRVVQVGEAHRRDVVGVDDDAARQQRVQRRFHARRGPAPIGVQGAARHEAHHFRVAHCCGVAQRHQGRQRQAGKPRAPDGAQVGAAALDQQRVAQLDRCVATAWLHQPRFPPDEI